MLFDVVYSGIEGGLKQSERIGSHSRFNILQDTLGVGDVTMFTPHDERERRLLLVLKLLSPVEALRFGGARIECSIKLG